MADKILTQPEIEAMLASMSFDDESAAAAEPEHAAADHAVKVYDFRRPDKFSKEHLRALRILHGSFARSLASSLTAYLRASLQVRLTMVEQVTYEEYIRSLPTPTVMYLVAPAPLPGQLVVEVNLGIARAILDRLLGGPGVLSSRPRDLTEVELVLLKTLGSFLAEGLRSVWGDVVALEPSVQEPVLSPEFVQVTTAGETTVMLVFEVAMLRTTGTLSICIPHPVLAPVLERVTSHVWFSGTRHGAIESEALNPRQELRAVVLPLTVELGGAELSVRQLLELRLGQVIKLDSAAEGSLPIRVGEHVKFTGRPGIVGRGLAVQVVGRTG